MDISSQESLSSGMTLEEALKADMGQRVTRSFTLEKANASSAMVWLFFTASVHPSGVKYESLMYSLSLSLWRAKQEGQSLMAVAMGRLATKEFSLGFFFSTSLVSFWSLCQGSSFWRWFSSSCALWAASSQSANSCCSQTCFFASLSVFHAVFKCLAAASVVMLSCTAITSQAIAYTLSVKSGASAKFGLTVSHGMQRAVDS